MSFDKFWEPPLPFIKDSGKNKIYQCPSCWSKNFWWHMEKQGGHCWSCHAHYSQKLLHAKLGLEWGKYSHQLGSAVPVEMPRRVGTLVPAVHMLPGVLPPEARCFLMGDKGLLEEELQHFRWHPQSNSVYVGLCPQRSDKGAMAWMTRGISSTGRWDYVEGDMNGYRYTKKDFYYSPTGGSVHPTEINVLVEGVFDAIRLNSCSPRVNAIACLGTKISEALLRQFITTYPTGKTVIWFDPDKAGRKGHNQLEHSLRYALGFNSIVIDHVLEPGDCSPVEARKVLSHHVKELLTCLV